MRAAFAIVSTFACGGQVSAPAVDAGGDALACAAATDAGNCGFARHALVCPNVGCVTDQDVCPNLPPDAGCANECAADEVAAACGSPSTSSTPPPSLDCRVTAPLPSGTILYCCRCAN